jgi:cation diffusion facilitator family transporter
MNITDKDTKDLSRIAFFSSLLNILVAGLREFSHDFRGALPSCRHHPWFIRYFCQPLVLAGIWLSKRKSEAFPWGLYKVENFVALVSAGLIFFAGYEIVHHVFKAEKTLVLGHFYSSLFGLLAIILAIAIFSRFEAKKAKDFNSPSLIADASHWYSDIASTALVLLALLGSRVGYPILDRLAALIMVGVIAKVGWDILKDSMKTLLDASVDPITLDRIRNIIRRFSQVREIKSIQARNSGRFVFVRLSLSLLENFSGSSISEKSGDPEEFQADKVTIHYEPVKRIFIYALRGRR